MTANHSFVFPESPIFRPFFWVHDKKEGFFDFSLFLALKV
jgi:hypothetical protein